jgi:tetratricopeptide (TPR) repeat protein
MAVIYLAKGNVAAAEATAREGLSISKLLSGADPRDAQSGLTLAEDSRLVADLESRRGHNRSAAADIRTALDLSQRLAQASPRDTETLAIEAGAYKTSGDIAGRAKDYSTALHEYNSAITILSKIYLQNSSNAGAGARLAAIFNSAGKANLALSRTKAAGDEFLKSIAIVEPMANSGHPSGQALYTAADAYAGLGEVDEAVASNVDAKPEVRARRLQAAAWYARSLQEWGRIQEAGAVSPDGFDCIARDVISRRLALIQRTVLASSQQ